MEVRRPVCIVTVCYVFQQPDQMELHTSNDTIDGIVRVRESILHVPLY